MFSQRVLVALDTGDGVVYAPASGWDKIYLLWTFRNFRSLPQTVLSPRQQQFMGNLYRDAAEYSDERDQAVVVGTVENFKPSSLAKLPAVKPHAASTGVRNLKAFYDRFAPNGMTVRIGTAALVLAIAVFAWHKLRAQPGADPRSTQTAAAAQASDSPTTIAQDTNEKNVGPATVQPPPTPISLFPSPISPSPVTDTQLMAESSAPYTSAKTEITARERATNEAPQAPAVPGKSEASERVVKADRAKAHPPVALLPIGSGAAADQPRMHISGRPRKLVYPVCPETHARGKVSLQAVVGYDGAVSRVSVLTGDRTLAAAAVEAVRQWRYEPSSSVAPHLERETDITISFISNEVVAVSFPNSAPLSR